MTSVRGPDLKVRHTELLSLSKDMYKAHETFFKSIVGLLEPLREHGLHGMIDPYGLSIEELSVNGCEPFEHLTPDQFTVENVKAAVDRAITTKESIETGKAQGLSHWASKAGAQIDW